MIPTNKFRFVKREIGTPFDIGGGMLIGDTVRIEHKNILQQWWVVDPDLKAGALGEWRDVPIEQE